MTNKVFLVTLLFLFTSLWVGAQTTFNYTGGVQEYEVPSCVTQIEVVVAGAQGGGANGGQGAVVTAIIDVTPGQILQINVGGGGNCPAAGYNGGGSGANASGLGNGGCGGGGASDIQVAPYGLNNRVVVAGGGGGMGGGNTDAIGGDGGCQNGANGNSPFGVGGEGGSQVSGGDGGPYWEFGFNGNDGFPGIFGIGGNGATDPCYNLGPGGGGGGGYYGGGGGGSDCFSSGSLGGGAGGGGSSLTPAGGNCTQGSNIGNGYVTITPNNEGMELEIIPATPEICLDDSVEITISGGVNYVWSPDIGLNTTTGATVMASPPTTQTYLVTADDGDDCTDTISVTITVLPDPVISVTPSAPEICPGESVDISAAGAGTYEWSPAVGLDNTQGANVAASPGTTQTYTVTGTSGNCSADTTVVVTVLDPPDISFFPSEPELCPDGSVEITATGGVSYSWSPVTGLDDPLDSVVVASPNATTTYTITGTDSNGCTNTADVTATVLPPPAVDAGEDLEICPGTSIELNGESATAVSFSWSPTESLDNPDIANPTANPDVTTTYTLEVTDDNGCVNTDEVTVSVVDESYEITNNASICEGENYTLPDGSDVEEAGTYENMFTSVMGCDSLVITELTVNPVYELEEVVEICEGDDYPLPDGTNVDEAGVYPVALQSSAGCDSTISFEIIVNPVYDIEIEALIPENETYTMPDGSEENTAGTYQFDFNTEAGCDSIVTVILEVQELVVIEQDGSICANENYTLPNGTIVHEQDIYEVILSSGGFDTLYVVDLTVFPTYDVTTEAAICQGELYTLPDGTEVNTGDTYTIEYTSGEGCDSIINIELEILSTFTITQEVAICPDETYTLSDGTVVDEEGLYPQVFTSSNGCDSTVNINLSLHPEYDMSVIWEVCSNDNPLDPFGNPITEDAEFFLDFTSAFGCDSLVHLIVEFGESSTTTKEVSFCSGEFFVTAGGQTITHSGTYIDVLQNNQGCDSTLVYSVTAMPSPYAQHRASQQFASIYDDSVQFFNESLDTDSLEWDLGIFGTTQEENPIVEFGDQPGFYPICLNTWNDYGCYDQHCFEFEVREDFAVYIPNAFSPNEDGINDLFFVQGKDIDPDNFLLQIFNSFGELVFESPDPDEKWDGSSQGKTHYSQTDVYVYRVIVSAKSVIDTREYTGKITVIR